MQSNHPKLAHNHPTHLIPLVEVQLVSVVKPPRTRAKWFFMPCWLCGGVVWGGSMELFNAVETSLQPPLHVLL